MWLALLSLGWVAIEGGAIALATAHRGQGPDLRLRWTRLS